jgi:outer membrane protein assembly factor BamA
VGAALLLAPAVLSAQGDSVAQVDIIDVIFRKRPAQPELYIGERFQATVLPSVSYNPAFGVVFSMGGAGLVRLGTPDSTSLSSFSANASYTTKGQFLVTFRSNIFLPKDNWNFTGDWRYWNTSQPTYGLGPIHPASDRVDMDFKFIRIYEIAYKKIEENLFAGLGFHLDDWFDIRELDVTPGDTTPYGEWTGDSPEQEAAVGISLNMLFDSRDNPLNPSRGVFMHVALRENAMLLGSDAHWNSARVEARAYPRLGPRTILGIWVLASFTGGHPPYFNLPALGWDRDGRSGRGYTAGRIRGIDGNYAEFELRHTFTRNGLLGGVAFVNFTASSDENESDRYSASTGYGVGGRLKLNKKTGTNIAVDYGHGVQGSSAFFFAINETF